MPACLTPAQVEAARKTYDGVKNPRTGEQIFTGWPRGSEGFGEAPGQSWRAYIMDPQEPMRVGFFKYFLFHDPNWDYRTIDWDRDLAYAEQKLPFMAAVERDLSAVQETRRQAADVHRLVRSGRAAAGHGRLLRGGGEDDGRAARRRANSSASSSRPGMGHCSGGPGPNQFDHLTALEQWVEKGVAPDKLIASHSHQRQGRSHAAAVRLPAGRALERHRAAATKRRTSPASPTPAASPRRTSTAGK